MPPYPSFAPHIAALQGSVYSALADKLAAHNGPTYPLHVGDTWMEPPAGCHMQDLKTDELPGLHRYAHPRGRADLLEAIAARVSCSGVPTTPRHILVAAGATGGLGAVIGALLRPGEKVLLLAPYWPLIAGIVRAFSGEPVAVPVFGPGDGIGGAGELLARLDAAWTPGCAALYVNSPNNPSGRVLPGDWLEALAGWARRRDVWLISDEVYESYAYTAPHLPLRPLAPERTFSAHSFSKAYGMAGNRCGYIVGPEEAVEQLKKVSTHTFYSTPTASQVAALRALEGPGDVWAAAAAASYAEVGARAARRLCVEAPEGGTFLFLDAGPALDGRGLPGLLEDCAAEGLLVAPGTSFGPFPQAIRVCFTACPPAQVMVGVGILARRLGLPDVSDG